MANNFKIDELSLREPTSVSFKQKHITNQERTMSGNLVVDYIATKNIVSVSWGALSNEEFKALKTHIDNKRSDNSFYNLEFTDPQNATTSKMLAYTEEISYYPYFMPDGSVIWRDVSIEFTEV